MEFKDLSEPSNTRVIVQNLAKIKRFLQTKSNVRFVLLIQTHAHASGHGILFSPSRSAPVNEVSLPVFQKFIMC